jgi:hypothetical protein
MFRFTIRDVLWLTVVVALAATLWISHHRYRQQVKESKAWEYRARSLRNDMMTGTNKNTDIEFIPDGLQYTDKKSN